MKKIISCFILLFFIGCGSSPMFHEPTKIVEKHISSAIDYNAVYTTVDNFNGCGKATFTATIDFAHVGDCIVSKKGIITVTKCEGK